jgi:hypothetical protein
MFSENNLSKSAMSARVSVYVVVMSVAVMTGLSISCKSKKPTEPTFAISATSGAHGTIVPSGTISVKNGADQAFTMTADSGYELVNLRIDGISGGLSTTYNFANVTANHYIYAGFSHVYLIAATAGLHGTITPQGNVSVTEGVSRVFTITPDVGYRISDVLVDGGSVGAVSSYTFVNVTGDHSISADFAFIPFVLSADSGMYYRGIMNSSVLSPQLILRATDSAGASANQWIHFSLLGGDGIIGADSVQTDAQGKVQPSYSFNGVKGHAIIRALWPQKDTLDLFLRASTLVWGDSAQGQYVRIGDRYSFVKAFNGLPASVDGPFGGLLYVNYEAALGVVVLLDDVNLDGVANNFELVVGIIVNTVYTGTFSNGIGIGADSIALVAAFGTPDTLYLDPLPPASWVYIYRTKGLTFWLDQSLPPKVFEIHLVPPFLAQPSLRRFGLPAMSK